MTAQGHPRTVFRRAIERGNYLVAITTAREVGRLATADTHTHTDRRLRMFNTTTLTPARAAAPTSYALSASLSAAGPHLGGSFPPNPIVRATAPSAANAPYTVARERTRAQLHDRGANRAAACSTSAS